MGKHLTPLPVGQTYVRSVRRGSPARVQLLDVGPELGIFPQDHYLFKRQMLELLAWCDSSSSKLAEVIRELVTRNSPNMRLSLADGVWLVELCRKAADLAVEVRALPISHCQTGGFRVLPRRLA
jgi:hypothetical protein